MDQKERPWSPEEDEMLLNLFEKHGRNWSLISKSIPGRSAEACEFRWLSFQWSFTPEEDEMLLNLFVKHGRNWSLISKSIPGKSDQSCRLRWLSLQWSFTPEKDEMLVNLVKKHGHNWSLISKSIPGKSAKTCELRWETVWSRYQSYIDNSSLKWKSSSMTNKDLNKAAHNIYIPPPCFSDIGRVQRSSYIHYGNLSHEVGGVSGQAPSIGDIFGSYVSSGGTHSYSRGQAPSIGDVFVGYVSSGGTHSYSRSQTPSIGDILRGNMSLGDTHFFSHDQPAPSWNALNKWESLP